MALLYHYPDRDFGCIIIFVMVLSPSDDFGICSMASGGKTWTNEQLLAALKELHTIKSSLQSVAAAYGIPKSTLSDYASGKVEIGSKQGPPTVLTTAEEKKLVEYCLHMASIGYGRNREQVCLTVKKILDKDGRPNPLKIINLVESGGNC